MNKLPSTWGNPSAANNKQTSRKPLSNDRAKELINSRSGQKPRHDAVDRPAANTGSKPRAASQQSREPQRAVNQRSSSQPVKRNIPENNAPKKSEVKREDSNSVNRNTARAKAKENIIEKHTFMPLISFIALFILVIISIVLAVTLFSNI